MAKKVSKNQRTDRGNRNAKKMVKIVSASRKDNGQYRFMHKMVEADALNDELKAAKAAL